MQFAASLFIKLIPIFAMTMRWWISVSSFESVLQESILFLKIPLAIIAYRSGSFIELQISVCFVAILILYNKIFIGIILPSTIVF